MFGQTFHPEKRLDLTSETNWSKQKFALKMMLGEMAQLTKSQLANKSTHTKNAKWSLIITLVEVKNMVFQIDSKIVLSTMKISSL